MEINKELQYIQQHLAWIIAVFALAWAVYQYIANTRRTRKAFTYRVLVDTPVLGSGKMGVHRKVQVTINDLPVSNVRLVVIDLRNTGGKELEPKDFHQAVRIEFPKGSQMVDFKPLEASQGFTPDLTVMQAKNLEQATVFEYLQLEPQLMNQGDFVKVSILASIPPKETVSVTGRIAGIKKLTQGSQSGLEVLAGAANLQGKTLLVGLTLAAVLPGLFVPTAWRVGVMESIIIALLILLYIFLVEAIKQF